MQKKLEELQPILMEKNKENFPDEDWPQMGMWIEHTDKDKGKTFKISNLRLNSDGQFD